MRNKKAADRNRISSFRYEVGGIGLEHPSDSRVFCDVQNSVTPKATLSGHSQNQNAQNPKQLARLRIRAESPATNCDSLQDGEPTDVAESFKSTIDILSQHPALTRFVHAWPSLPPHIRETISSILDVATLNTEESKERFH